MLIKQLIVIFVLSVLVFACNGRNLQEIALPEENKELSLPDGFLNADYTLIDNYIYVEKFDSTNRDKNRYDYDNQIFRHHAVFKYAYEYEDASGKPFYVKGFPYDWEFIPKGNRDDQTITTVIITVKPNKAYKDYPQTRVSYAYPPYGTHSASGVVENQMNVWLHPPRDGFFEILELNPFPYIKKPYVVGNNWLWSLEIGSQWADKRWKEWEGNITNRYKYEITGKEVMDTKLGSLLCYQISSHAESSLGRTELIAYFNEENGFIRLDYKNIDGSKVSMELEEITHAKSRLDIWQNNL